jgi:hypothetical protein
MLGGVSRVALVLLGTHAAWAQYVVSAHAGTVHFTGGQVSIDGEPVTRKPLHFPELKVGQVLRTDNGRAEVLLGPGVFLRLWDHGALRMLNTRLEDTQVEVLRGTALVEVVAVPKGSEVHVVIGATRTGFKGMGLHRFEAEAQELRVYGGRAEILAADQKVQAGRGTLIHLGDPLSTAKFDLRRKDAFHQWAARRSFLLYTSNRLARFRQTNWEITRSAWVRNRDFGVMFYWQALARAYARQYGGQRFP